MPKKRLTRTERMRKLAPYKSQLEVDVTQALEKKGIPFQYEREYLVYIEPQQTRKYKPDLFLDNGIIVEMKGQWTPQDRKKMGLVIEQHPQLDIRMLFERDRKITKTSNTRYTDWCERRGIKHAVGRTVPEDWLNEKPATARAKPKQPKRGKQSDQAGQ